MVGTSAKESVFQRAGRQDDGRRTFRIIEGERIFRADVDRVPT
jgi:hypothetical protein